jgi:dienelactone hydrolase
MRALEIAVAVLLAVGPAVADDACLTGASLLPDQRALATLRTDTETQCPCASAVSRGAFQKCARGVVRTSLGSGALRAACRRTATRIDRGAVCGSTKVTCGRFKPTAETPLSCHVVNPAACTDGRRFESHACAAETYCADVVDWTASTCVDVRENGPFDPGARVVTFTKTSAETYCTGGSGTCGTMPFGPGCLCAANADCASGVCETQQRVLNTSIWYPAPPGSGSIDPNYGAVLNAPLDGSGGPYPLLMFSHGSCGYPNQSTFMTALLASHGFVVVAPPHPGNTIYDLPRCMTAPALAAAFVERPQDILFVLDGMLAANADSGSPFFGAIDDNRIGMSGHSYGGLTTYLTVPLEPRFKVALAMAPALGPSPYVFTIPSLNMFGQIDSLVNLPNIRTAYADAQPPKYLVEIANAGHYAFSNGCFPGPDCAPPATLTQPEAHDAVLRWVLPFLKVYLAGDPSFKPFLAPPAGPGFVLQAEP